LGIAARDSTTLRIVLITISPMGRDV